MDGLLYVRILEALSEALLHLVLTTQWPVGETTWVVTSRLFIAVETAVCRAAEGKCGFPPSPWALSLVNRELGPL